MRRLLIVSSCAHYEFEGQLWSYGPYAREIELWADLFETVRIACPVRREKPPGDCTPLARRNISALPVTEAGGDTWKAKLGLALAAPLMSATIVRGMLWADGVHVRCPGNLGLLGALLAPLVTRRMVAKYAGSWMRMPGDDPGTMIQRALLRRWFRGPVTVYGEWPGEPANIVPFFTSLVSEEQMDRARRAAGARKPSKTVRILYTGRLSQAKNIDVTLEAAAAARAQGAAVEVTIIGDGPEREALEALARKLGIAEWTTFTGGVGFETVMEHLERANTLVLASETEGWPKSAAEAMAFGVLCIGSNRGYFGRMLEGRGIAIEPRDKAALTGAIADLAANPENYEGLRRNAAAWAQQFSMEGLREAIRKLLEQRWRVRLRGGDEKQDRVDVTAGMPAGREAK
ncbi:MAG: glycosyltransferase [Bryobacteraceae bacterium]